MIMATETQKKIRLADIARMTNMSISTVSAALLDHPDINSETKRRVQLLSQKLGYLPPGERTRRLARKKQTQEIKRFGFLLIGGRLNDEIIAGMIHEMMLQASEMNVRIEMSAVNNIISSETTKQHIQAFSQGLDGLIVEGHVNKTIFQYLENTHLPYVVIGSLPAEPNTVIPVVSHMIMEDNIAMGQVATHHLFACGHQRIGFICEMLSQGLWYYKWLAGYRLAHYDVGIEPDATLIHIAGREFAGGKPAAEYFSEMPNRPTAYVVPDIRTGASFIEEMSKRKTEIPRDSIILGSIREVARKYQVEGYPMICSNINEIGRYALEYLVRLQQTPTMPPATILIPFTTYNLQIGQ
jgi:DNA-binding LacI/PurR family transcriptional regulator